MSLDSTVSYRAPAATSGLLQCARRIVARPSMAVLVAALLAILPAWNSVWYQDDQLPTLFRALHTSLAHEWGVLYPRLAPELGFGYGRLLHQFYPPLGVEVAAWLHALGLGYIDAARMTFSLCLLASAFGMYAYARAVLGGPWPAALAAVAYVWSPYVLLDAHKGGVLGESVALALMPWSLLAMDRLARRGGTLWLAATAGTLALVVLGHNITALFFVGLATVYGAIVAVSERERLPGRALVRRLALVAVSLGLGLALAAIYWLPALVELHFSRVSEQRSGDFNVVRNLVEVAAILQPAALFDYYVETVPRYGLAAGLLTIAAIVLVAAALLHTATRPRPADAERTTCPDRAVLIAFGLCFVAVLLLQLRQTAIFWQMVPLISFVQFPQRLFVFGSFAGAIVLGGMPWALRALGLSGRAALASGLAVVVVLGATSLPGLFWTWPVAASHVISEDQVGIATAAERRLAERRAFDDYFPIWVEEDAALIPRPPSASRSELYEAANAGPVPRLRILERGYLSLRAETEADAPSSLVLHTFYFPGWQAAADGQPLTVEPVGPIGLARVQVPAGQHVVEVWFGETPVRQTATLASFGALAIVLLLLVKGLGPGRALSGLTLVLLIVIGPWLLHRALTPPPRSTIQALDAEVTSAARLVGVELAQTTATPGETISATVLWQATASSPRDLQSGLRLVPADAEQTVAERWARPDRERTPTGKWIVGELVPDTMQLRIPPNARPGPYRLQAGLRDGDAPTRGPSALVTIATLDVR